MAATLPAINQFGGSLVQSPTIRQHKSPSTPGHAATTPSPPSHAQSKSIRYQLAVRKKSQGKKERELEERKEYLRAQQPQLNKIQTSEYRASYKHNLCLDMLSQGYHKSYAELFALIRQQEEERQIAGPESVLWNEVQLCEEPEKLEILKAYLTEAEAASRTDEYVKVYQCQYQLAKQFQTSGDKWLSDHFYENCLATSGLVVGDEGRMAAEGHCNVGLSLEKRGDNIEAAENFELFHRLCEGKDEWSQENGDPLHYQAAHHLARIYTTIGNQHDADGDTATYLDYMEQANTMAWNSGDRKLEAETCFRVGVAYEKNGRSDTALKHLTRYLATCTSLEDNEGYGAACEAIARSYESQNKIEESIKYLEMFVEVAEKTKNDKAISRACSNLGAMFNSLGRYDQAVEYFNRSYNISRALNDTEAISSSRVLFGVAAAHRMLQGFASHIEVAMRPTMERMIEWKDNRGDEFDKDIPAEQSTSPTQEETQTQEEEKTEETGESQEGESPGEEEKTEGMEPLAEEEEEQS